MKILKKILKLILCVIGFALLLAVVCYFLYRPTKKPVWGVNFSVQQAYYLGLDPYEAFQKILNDLRPKKIRLVAYWEDVERTRWEYDFSQTDRLLGLASKTETKVVLVLGRKQPRWPECHVPEWYNSLSPSEQKQALLSFVSETVRHFQSNRTIERWQVENEPFFNYGPNCPTSEVGDVKDEINLVKSLDTRPIVVTDSGEKGTWFSAARLSDVFGTTMYRRVDDPRFGGQITYPLPPAWYRMRAGFTKLLFRKSVVGVELQAEPWFHGRVDETPLEEQLSLMDVNLLKGNFEYAKKTGLPEHYLWGAEWWYYMKVKHNHGEYWEAAKQQINN